MFGSSILGGIGLLEGVQDMLCAALAVGCLSADPGLPVAEAQPHAAATATSLTSTPSPVRASTSQQSSAAKWVVPGAQVSASPPVRISLRAVPPRIKPGELTRLYWKAENATNCRASGGWDGAKFVEGRTGVPGLRKTSEFRLSCSNTRGKGAMARVTVHVGSPNTIRLNLSAHPRQVNPGQSSRLVWRAENADRCRAEGAWAGSKPTSGQFDTGALKRGGSYRLVCTNGNVEEVASVFVSLDSDSFALRWKAPERNIDGSLANDIAGYRVYWGTRAGRFTGSYTINSPTVTEWKPFLRSGTYYFAISAFDASGNESDKSAALRLRVP